MGLLEKFDSLPIADKIAIVREWSKPFGVEVPGTGLVLYPDTDMLRKRLRLIDLAPHKLEVTKRNNKKASATLARSYVKECIHDATGIPFRDIPEELVEPWRKRLALSRAIKKAREVLR